MDVLNMIDSTEPPAGHGRGNRPDDLVESTLARVREQLGIDVSYTPTASLERIDRVDGTDAPTARGIGGRPDLFAIDAPARVLMTIPVRISDGTVCGTLCVLSRSRDRAVAERDAGFLRVLASVIADHVERDELAGRERRDRVERLQRVLAGEVLRPVFQPIIDLTSDEVVGYESLARFAGEHRWGPERWFSDAAACGLGVDLELAAVEAALERLPDLPAGAYLALNISAEAATAPRMATTLSRAPSERIVLELTEHSQVEDYPALRAGLDRLRDQGLRLAIDDAGAGYASFRHILTLAPDIIKLDISLTRDIDTDAVRRALATSLVAFAREIGATIVAEGIETAAEIGTLRALGVDFGQGHFLARPAPMPRAGDRRPPTARSVVTLLAGG